MIHSSYTILYTIHRILVDHMQSTMISTRRTTIRL
uniref:Uncharacterized protein n=1 Tax=virus sp. ctBM815 TaxID=2825806 RepID=A0A8S5RJD4_9VIRU|nr:MAG TPA: hypothetical protein [virus sp. ctBM815]